MKFSNLQASILAQFLAPEGYKTSFYIRSSPGTGKSTLAFAIADKLQALKNIPDERRITINPSLRESSDFLGLPDLHGEVTRWVPPEDLYRIRAGQGPSILILEELSDADMSVQNPLCRIILDRHAGSMPLSEELYIICTGNRTEDRSGANRLSTKLGNRMRILDFEVNIDEWLKWAEEQHVPTPIQMFIKWDNSSLNDFDPKCDINPTPRSWADIARIPFDDPAFADRTNLFGHCCGSIGEKAATKFVGFLNLFDKLPDFGKIKEDPNNAPINDDPQIQYVVIGRIIDSIKKAADADHYWGYLKRMPNKELLVMAFSVLRTRTKGMITKTTAWKEFSKEYSSMVLNCR